MGGGGGGGGFRGTRGSKVSISDKRMYQDGFHFNKHGREMGYTSKKEYDASARAFATKYQEHPEAQSYRGQWNGSGNQGGEWQRIITYQGKSVIINEGSGQIIDYYNGTDFRGLVHLERLR